MFSGENIFLLLFIFSGVSVSCLEYDRAFNDTVEFILNEVNAENIGKNLRYLTLKPHLGGTIEESETADWVADTWREQGLDEVHLTPYDVLLSYPVKEKPNYARIHDESGDEIWRSQGKTPGLHSPEEYSDHILPDFNGYSPPGNVTAEVIYANFGREQDFDELQELGINVTDKIVIAKYGEVFRANIVHSAEIRGAVGVLLYADPKQYAQEGPDRVYPHTVFMPETAAPYGTVKLIDGDPLTPFYPAIESAFRLSIDEARLPKIPVMPLSYKDAGQILSKMSGDTAPEEWQGSLNMTYKLGPGLEGEMTVSMEVNTHPQRTTVKNVIGVIKGQVEPDRYVIIGNHRDAWIFGSVDPSSGSAAMMELTRTLMQMKKNKGWTPRRSLVFCSWGAEEYGLVGSQEWTEQFSRQLANRAVAYLNMDMAIEGNYTLRTKAVPILNTLARDITKLIPNPDPAEVEAGRLTVYDTWALRQPDANNPEIPKMILIGSGSDYKGFQHNFGVPSLDYRYTHSKEMYSESLYHTLYETFYLVDELYDRGFNFHKSVTQLFGVIGVYLADQEIIPLSVTDSAEFIAKSQQNLVAKLGDLLDGRNQSVEYFLDAGKTFNSAAEEFTQRVLEMNKTDILGVRRVNDQLMQVEKAFLENRGLPGRPEYNHVVVAPSKSDSYAGAAFSGLSDALYKIQYLPDEEQKTQWRVFDEHIAACTHFILMAAKTLSEELW